LLGIYLYRLRDLLSWSNQLAATAVFDSQNVILSEAYMVPDYADPVALADSMVWVDWFKDLIDPNEEPMEPVSDIYYPIIDKIDSVTTIDEAYDPQNFDVKGFISLSIYWRDTMKNVLPLGSDGIVVVFESDCNPTFTYQMVSSEGAYFSMSRIE